MVRAVKVVPLADDGGAGGLAPRSFGGAGSGSAGGSYGKRMGGRVPSLVFDLEDLDGGSSQHPAPEPLDDASVAEVAGKLSALLEPWSEPGARAVASGGCAAASSSRGHVGACSVAPAGAAVPLPGF